MQGGPDHSLQELPGGENRWNGSRLSSPRPACGSYIPPRVCPPGRFPEALQSGWDPPVFFRAGIEVPDRDLLNHFLPSYGIFRTCLQVKNVPDVHWQLVCRTPGRLKKEYRYGRLNSNGYDRSLIFPGLWFFDEFSLATRLFHHRNCCIGRFLDCLFCFFVIGGGHFDPVRRRAKVKEFNIFTGNLGSALFNAFLITDIPSGSVDVSRYARSLQLWEPSHSHGQPGEAYRQPSLRVQVF